VRSPASTTCTVAGVVLILVGGLLGYGTRAAFDSTAFADRAAQSLADPRVASFVAQRVTDAVIEQGRDLIPFRPIILATTQSIVSSAPFRAVVRRSVRESHELVLTQGGQDILLTLSDVGAILRSALAPRPDIAERLPPEVLAVIGSLEEAPFAEPLAELLRFGQRASSQALLVLVLGVLFLGLGVVLAPGRRAAVLRTGLALTGAAALILLVVQLGGPVLKALAADAATGAALAGLWDSFTAGLWSSALGLGVFGLALAAASTAFVQELQLHAVTHTVRLALWSPQAGPWAKLARALALILAGTLAVTRPLAAVKLGLFIAGSALLFVGLTDLFRVLLPLEAAAPADAAPSVRVASGRRRTLRVALVSILAVALPIAAAVMLTRGGPPIVVPFQASACNGQRTLCDRPLDEVVFPATHNSMSAADHATWMFANHEAGIMAQLEDGVRGLLIDVYPGIRVGNAVKTDIEEGELVQEKYEAMLGPSGFDAAIRIRNRMIGGTEGTPALYLCHGLCELGANPLVPLLRSIREFLILHPGEVLIIIIEDAVAPAEIEAAFQSSGLVDFVYRGDPAPPWPTLREMIATDQRVLVLAEKDSQGVPWYHQAFEVLQETPYSFHDESEFSCEPHRGGTAGSLLLMNHWISTPPSSVPSDAKIANAYEVLLARARACRAERGLLPNLIAVDFYRTGDLFNVVWTLNGAPTRTASPTD
jgi:hypothetical protein